MSLDGVGDVFVKSRGYSGAPGALRAMKLLVEAGVPTGANFVLSRITLAHLEQTLRAVAEVGGNEVEVLRFKPAGRGAEVYDRYRLTPSQAEGLLETMLELGARVPEVTLKIDCSLVPFLCAGDPELDALELSASSVQRVGLAHLEPRVPDEAEEDSSGSSDDDEG